MTAPLPINEKERLKALRRYAILDTPPEAAFDRLASLVTRLLNVPMATVTLVDEHRQWFKASCGMDQRETSREIAFCAHAILKDEMMIVPDASLDQRFAQNPLVTGPQGIRFYAGAPLKGFDGSNIGVLCAIDTKPREFSAEQQMILKDLAEITNSELHLRLASREKNQLAAAVTHMNAGVLVTDPHQPDHPIVFCNPAFSSITGYAYEEAMGRNCQFLYGPNSDPLVRKEIRQALEQQRPFHGLTLNYRKNGETFWCNSLISPVFDEKGELQNFVRLLGDVTERKSAEDALKQNYEKLKELEILRDNLTHMIVHDLRSPLTATMGFLALLEMHAAERQDEEGMGAIHGAQEGANQINSMITSLLDISRLEEGKMPLEINEFDLTEIAKTALAQTVALKGKKLLEFEGPDQPVRVRCDAMTVSRVIANLVGNAFKFSPKQSAVSVRISREEGLIRLSVTDAGPGIPREDYQRIFEKFGQLKGIRRVHSTGLGLTFCKLAIEAQGGKIGVESEVGHGSTFWFTLPPAIG
jgi:PAS domain S-box-containing protein